LTFEALRRAEAHALARADRSTKARTILLVLLIERLIDFNKVEILRTLAANSGVRAPDIGDVVKATPWK
jgi:hypothetical protein